MSKLLATACAGVLCALAFAGSAQAGPVFLTGHDPDFHTQSGAGATLLQTGLNFAMGGTLNDNVHKFLWVESLPGVAVTGGHLRGANSLPLLGLTAVQDYDWVDGAGFATANLSAYTAIGIASTFGGMLTSAELNALIARSTDIKNFINAGGGLFASAECEAVVNCLDDTLTAAHGPLFGYLPVTVTSVATSPPYTPTAYGLSLGLTAGALNDPTHNSFNAVGGLNIVDTDNEGNATTLAGIVKVGGGGFTPVPEPITLSLFGAGILGLGALRRRKAKKS